MGTNIKKDGYTLHDMKQAFQAGEDNVLHSSKIGERIQTFASWVKVYQESITVPDLEEGCYYQINNTKKILYWDGYRWMKPLKDHFSGYVGPLDKQPIVKTVKKIHI